MEKKLKQVFYRYFKVKNTATFNFEPEIGTFLQQPKVEMKNGVANKRKSCNCLIIFYEKLLNNQLKETKTVQQMCMQYAAVQIVKHARNR